MMTACYTQSFILKVKHILRVSQKIRNLRACAEAGAIVETGTFTPITDEAFINYPMVLNLK